MSMRDELEALAKELLDMDVQDHGSAVQAGHDILDILSKPEEPRGDGLTWKGVALVVGEHIGPVGPVGYYSMTPEQWMDWAIASLVDAAIASPARTEGLCQWTEDNDGIWQASCDPSPSGMWVFTEGEPEESHVKYCPFCGKPARFVHWTDEDAALAVHPPQQGETVATPNALTLKVMTETEAGINVVDKASVEELIEDVEGETP